MNRFLDIVPKPTRTAAGIIAFVGALIGMTAGAVHGLKPEHIQAIDMSGGVLLGLLVGSLIGVWVLCLGYVYGDARRRSMPPALWVLVAVLVPNLLGFLLYFVLRRPVATPCGRCSRPVATDQRFCSWCGYEIAYSAPGGTPPPTTPSTGVSSAV